MYTPGLALTLVLSLAGIGALSYGTLVRIGKLRSWWLLQSNPVVPEATAYLGIPFGISLLIMSVAFLMPSLTARKTVSDYGLVFAIFSFVLAVWRPRWLTPKWLLWLEDRHHDILSLLRQEARELGGREWSKRTRTQAGLEEWVAEVRRKHGLE